MEGKMKTFIQKLGKSLMGPLSIIVAAGLLLGLASTLQNPNVFGNVLQDVAFVNNFVSLVNALAGALFGLLPILFCMSVAQGMSREDREDGNICIHHWLCTVSYHNPLLLKPERNYSRYSQH